MATEWLLGLLVCGLQLWSDVSIIIITFIHGIYNYIPEPNHVSTVYSVAAVLYLQSVLHVMLFRPCNMFCTVTSALPAICAPYPIWLLFAVP